MPYDIQSVSAEATALLALLGPTVGTVTGLLGLACVPLNVVDGVLDQSCANTAACCSTTGLLVSSILARSVFWSL